MARIEENMSIQDRIQQLASDLSPRLIEIRRYLHQNPELSYEEFETTRYLKQCLESTRAEIRTDYADTGVVGIIRGNGTGKCVALRGDIDALPIVENTGLEFTSKNPGVMHACGHDSHATVVVGAALVLSEIQEELGGTAKIILQPGEEKNPGGASIMVKNGVLKDPDVDVIYGLHSDPRFKVGEVGYREGPAMAEADEFYVTIKGKSGHGASPHLCVDPIVIASQVVTAFQNIRSRLTDPLEPVVVTIGKISGGKTTNVIPDEVEMVGTVRTFRPGLGKEIEVIMRRILEGITHAYGADFRFEMSYGSPSVINDSGATQFLLDSGLEYLGRQNCHFIEKPSLGGEDFAFYLQEVPGCFFRLGTGNPEKGIAALFHQPDYDIDENALSVGAGFMAFLVYNYLNQK